MAMEAKMPHGPWKEIFYGQWSGYEVRMYENPDKYNIILVFEREKEREIKGIVVILSKFFVVEGEASHFVESIGGYSLVFEKFYPTFKVRYLAVSSGPKYVEAELLTKGIEEAFSEVEKRSEDALEKSKTFRVELTELKHAAEEYSSKLFSEPILLPGLVFRQVPEKAAGAVLLLGKKIDGSPAEENVNSLSSTVVIGDQEQTNTCLQVIAESCVLAGLAVVIFDEADSFGKMSAPNPDFPHEEYPNLQPIGMPIKSLEPGGISIDLNIIEKEVFRELIRVEEKEGNYVGKEAAELLEQVLEKDRGKFNNITDFEKKLIATEEEEKKFHVYRAVRWIRVMDKVFPNYFGGKLESKKLITPYLKTMGSIVRVNLKGVPIHIKKGFVYSIMKSLYEEYSSRQLSTRVMGVISFAHKYVPSEPKKKTDLALLNVLNKCEEFGVNYCLSTEHEIDLNPEVAKTASMKIEYISGNEAAIKEKSKRPYRVKIRARLSA